MRYHMEVLEEEYHVEVLEEENHLNYMEGMTCGLVGGVRYNTPPPACLRYDILKL